MLHKTLCASALILAFAALVASPAQAQTPPCGQQCDTCAGGGGWAGFDPDESGFYNRTCFENIPFCVACGPDLVTDLPSFASNIFEAIEGARLIDLSELVADYGDRLLVSTERNLVVLRGSTCDPDALTAVSFIKQDRAVALAGLGVPSLERYLSSVPQN